MQPTTKDTEKDPARPTPADTQSKTGTQSKTDTHSKPAEERGEHDRLKRTADEMSRRGLKRQHKGEVGKSFPK
jgi:hypothetical protein